MNADGFESTDEEIKAQRGGENHGPRFRCSHAEKSVETNLADFRGMRDGKYKPREAFLRMKQVRLTVPATSPSSSFNVV